MCQKKHRTCCGIPEQGKRGQQSFISRMCTISKRIFPSVFKSLQPDLYNQKLGGLSSQYIYQDRGQEIYHGYSASTDPLLHPILCPGKKTTLDHTLLHVPFVVLYWIQSIRSEAGGWEQREFGYVLDMFLLRGQLPHPSPTTIPATRPSLQLQLYILFVPSIQAFYCHQYRSISFPYRPCNLAYIIIKVSILGSFVILAIWCALSFLLGP